MFLLSWPSNAGSLSNSHARLLISLFWYYLFTANKKVSDPETLSKIVGPTLELSAQQFSRILYGQDDLADAALPGLRKLMGKMIGAERSQELLIQLKFKNAKKLDPVVLCAESSWTPETRTLLGEMLQQFEISKAGAGWTIGLKRLPTSTEVGHSNGQTPVNGKVKARKEQTVVSARASANGSNFAATAVVKEEPEVLDEELLAEEKLTTSSRIVQVTVAPSELETLVVPVPVLEPAILPEPEPVEKAVAVVEKVIAPRPADAEKRRLAYNHPALIGKTFNVAPVQNVPLSQGVREERITSLKSAFAQLTRAMLFDFGSAAHLIEKHAGLEEGRLSAAFDGKSKLTSGEIYKLELRFPEVSWKCW